MVFYSISFIYLDFSTRLKFYHCLEGEFVGDIFFSNTSFLLFGLFVLTSYLCDKVVQVCDKVL